MNAQDIFQHLPIIGKFSIVFGLIVILPKLAERAGLPGVFGLLVGGILLGPNILGLVNPQGVAMSLFSELGKLLLMFFAGFEVNLLQVQKEGKRTSGFGLLTFALPLVIGAGVGLLLDYSLNSAILIGSLMASHTLLGLPVIKKLDLMKNNPVIVTIGATIITDILSMLVLAICIMIHVTGFSSAHLITALIELAIYVPLVVFGLSWAAKKIFYVVQLEEYRLGILILMICVAALLAQAIELEGIVGAFLAGIAVNRALGEDRKTGHSLEVISQTLFIPVFFLATGFLVNFKIFIDTLVNNSLMVVLVVGGLFLAKYLAARVAGIIYHFNKTESLLMWSLSIPQVAATLAATIVAYSTLNAAGERLLTEPMLNSVVVLVVVTSVAGPILTKIFGAQLVSQDLSGVNEQAK